MKLDDHQLDAALVAVEERNQFRRMRESMQELREAVEAALKVLDEWTTIPHIPWPRTPLTFSLLRETETAATCLRTALANLSDAEWANQDTEEES